MSAVVRKSMPQQATASAGVEGGDELQTPSIITPLHVQDVETSTVAGAPRAWRRMTQLEHAFRQERLGALNSNDALRRLDAGTAYTKFWDTAQGAGRDSTQALDVSRSMGSGIPLTMAQADAVRRLVQIEMHLGRNDRTIIRAVCGRGNSPAEAVALAGCCKDTRVTARFCETLDAVADAIERTAKSKPR